MHALQEWYDYVDSVSRPVGSGRAAAAPAEPASPELLPSGSTGNTIDLGPRLRARRFIASLLPFVEAQPRPAPAAWIDPREVPTRLPDLRFSRPGWAVPRFEEYLPKALLEPNSPFWEVGRWDPPQQEVFQTEPHHAEPVELVSHVEAPAVQAAPEPLLAVSPVVMPRVPRHWQVLLDLPVDEVAQNSYKKPFRESRDDMVTRLLDPPLTLEEAARLLGVCPTTVRRYTNRGCLKHFRTQGNQRRFRLSDVLAFLEKRADEIAADAAAEAAVEAAQERAEEVGTA